MPGVSSDPTLNDHRKPRQFVVSWDHLRYSWLEHLELEVLGIYPSMAVQQALDEEFDHWEPEME